MVEVEGSKKDKVAVFPGYFFVEFEDDAPDVVHTILQTPHVKRYLGFLSPSEEEELLRVEEDETYSRRLTDQFISGDIIEVKGGLFSGYEAEVVAIKNDLIQIRIDLNGKPVVFSTKPDEIQFCRRP